MAKKGNRLNLEENEAVNNILDSVQEENAMAFITVPGNNKIEESQKESKVEPEEKPSEEFTNNEEESSEESVNTEEEESKAESEKESSGEPVKKNQSDLNQMNFKKAKEELKDKRFSLLIKPSLYNRLKDLAEEKGTSVNNVINVILESVLEAQKGK